jgi:hypothetical protein
MSPCFRKTITGLKAHDAISSVNAECAVHFFLDAAARTCHNAVMCSYREPIHSSFQDNPRMSLSTPRIQPSAGSQWLWIALLALASVALSFKLSCATPFAALATLAALHMTKSDGLALVLLAWAANQLVGYGFLGYPRDAESYTWGLAIGIAAVATFATAVALAPRVEQFGRAPMMLAMLAAAFVVYEAILFAATAVLPATDVAFSWKVIAEIGLVNAAVFPALLLAHKGAELVGLTGERSRA